VKTYTVNIGGLDHTLLLSDGDAKRLGAKVVETPEAKSAPKPANKARTAVNKGA
jgi:hypothetical protein